METRIQVTLTVSEAKRIIAKGVATLPEVQQALSEGKVLLKGGTTVSAIGEELIGQPLKISGRVSPRGTRAAFNSTVQGHVLLLTSGSFQVVEDSLKEIIPTLGRQDIIIIGANALDPYGNAAMCMGGVFGGPAGEVLAGVLGCGARIIIPVGLEKLIPGPISEAVMAAGRNTMRLSRGMAVGMLPLIGQIVTERDALALLANVSCTVIAKGGIDGAEGATTMVVSGSEAEVAKAASVIDQIRGCTVSGLPESLAECKPGGESCKNHKGCLYKAGKSGFELSSI